jgi:hypothetical protein
MPSSQCNQISLHLGELYNDIVILLGQPSPEANKMLLKQLSEYAKMLDQLVTIAEKAAYDAGWENGVVYGRGTQLGEKVEQKTPEEMKKESKLPVKSLDQLLKDTLEDGEKGPA